jgi:phenylpyruvate tautomerase PptA (4-oxalocrotonate tautomerase family)
VQLAEESQEEQVLAEEAEERNWAWEAEPSSEQEASALWEQEADGVVVPGCA